MNCQAMNTAPSSCSSSASYSSTFHPPLLLPRATCSSQRMFRCPGVHLETCINSNLPKNHIISRYSSGWSEAQSLVSKRPLNKYLLPSNALVTSKTPDVSAASLIGDEKIGVLLLNLGGPETLEDVQPFLFNLFADPDIIRLPRLFRFLQKPLAQFVSVLRAPKSKEGYASIGGGSPLRRITDAQAEELRKSLWAKNVPAKVYVGMRYWHPFTEEAIEQIKRDGITKLVVLPLYPQFSISTSGSSLRLLESIFREDEYLVNMQHTVIPSWYQREGYIKAMANLIEKQLETFDCPDKVMIFFSAHGVPLAYVEEAGDPYKAEMEECVDLIMDELEKRNINNNYTLAYQSRVGPVEWLKPYTDETIIELGKKGVKSLLAVPISFVSEHIETLEEIDVEYKELALKSGIEKWGRSGPACTDDSTCMHKASIGTLDANFVNNQISGCIGSDELILLGKASDNIIKEGVVQTNTWCISGPACILNKASIDTLDANYVNDQISECIGSDELILLGKASENMVGVNQISSAMSSGLMHEEAISLGKFQDTTISIGPEQTAHLIPTAFVQENHGANSCSNDWCYDRKDFNDTGADLSDMVNCGEGHRAEAHLNAIISEVESAASELVPSYAQEHASDASNVCLQSVQSEYGSVSSNTDCEKPGGFSASEKGDIEDESTLSTIFTRSDHSCRVDLLEEIIEDAKNNKKTLFLAVESVMNMMRDVELKEKEAEQAKEEAARGGVDILTKVEELKQILTHAKEANEMRAGEVYGEKAILATELRELQTRLLSLSEERDRFLSILDEMRETLQARLAAAEEMRKAAEEEKLEKEACARNALAEQEAIMEKVVQESKILEQEAEENSKLQEFLIDRGQIVDSLQGEISVICQDVILLKQKFDKRLPLSKSISSSQTSCMLASSGSSLNSVAPSLVSEQWETPKSSEKRSRTTSINSESPKGKLEKEKGELLEDGWDLFENEADL